MFGSYHATIRIELVLSQAWKLGAEGYGKLILISANGIREQQKIISSLTDRLYRVEKILSSVIAYLFFKRKKDILDVRYFVRVRYNKG